MSDGNFKRALLPHTPYASGLKVGKAMMKMQAIKAFAEWLHEERPELSDERLRACVENYRKRLGS